MRLDAEVIKKHIGAPEVFVYDSIDSTSNEAKRKFREGIGNDAVFAAEMQTAGRGRSGKSFYSPCSTGLYFTALIHKSMSISLAATVTPAAAVAVCEALEELTDTKPQIKWVNDIFLCGKKICGILTEALTDSEGRLTALAIGIGINLNTVDFPAELSDIAASVGVELDKSLLLSTIYKKLVHYIHGLSEINFYSGYRDRLFILGKEITFCINGAEKCGIVRELGESFELYVDCEDEVYTLKSGEISIKSI